MVSFTSLIRLCWKAEDLHIKYKRRFNRPKARLETADGSRRLHLDATVPKDCY